MAKIGNNTVECWNCGRCYTKDNFEVCPECGEYSENILPFNDSDIEEDDFNDDYEIPFDP
jgi:rRNA maturation endonuclease Nob1